MGSSMGPTPGELPGLGSSIAASLVSLGVVCLVAYLALRWLSRRTSLGPNVGGPLRVLARQNLDPRRSVFVLEAAGRCFLVGAGDGGMSLLAELDRATVVRDVEASRPKRGLDGRFADVLSRVLARRAKPAEIAPASPVSNSPGLPETVGER